ncbi:MoaD/ThiS family protein [Janthinobacterium sp. B9-8]|uniref:MoaD/ThiS family protein n=1 Tax=Janthinobacterium sp. B9-8 TaxID=1236179 RepID=UPI00061D162D|nr:MoaD/ThiS family protein [Janthinobacterium sp. B9-8]AMC36385.1 molybdopterin synthase sulfur carrier subunit [Janthinobacterium sp. B9-8]
MIRILYFARLRDVFACSEEALPLPVPATVAALIAILVERGGVWADELSGSKVFRVAINQEMASLHELIPAHAEVAIFPPVTGG